nr:RNA-directed DNA polymerase, eukaryota, reverse transcriptase zinc-binding domain protein [Tanacetum cinerariifolium]
MGSHHLHANVARFMRPPAVKSGGYMHQNGKYMPKKIEYNSNNGRRIDKMSYVNVVNGDTKSTEACEPALLLDESCLNQLDYSLGLLGKVKEFSSFDNIRMVLGNEGATSWFSQIIQASKEFVIDERITWVDIEGIPLKLWSKSFIKEDFDGSDVEKEGDNNVSMVPDSMKEDVNVQAEEKGLNPKAKKDWVKEICVSHKVNFLTLQETKMEDISLIDVKCCRGNYAFEYVYSPADYLVHVISKWDGDVIVMGDFNEVRFKNERFVSLFHAHGTNAFNRFILQANVQEIPLGGCSFNWYLSDHRPIMLHVSSHDYGPILFRMYHYWFVIDGFEEMISKAWCKYPIVEVHPMLYLMYKMKFLKKCIREWNGKRQSNKCKKWALKKDLHDLEIVIDQGNATDDILYKRMEIIKDIQEAEKVDNLEAAQKAKIKWAIDGDENTKFYHGILNKKRNQLSIRRVLKDGMWIDNPVVVKKEFLEHFSTRFQPPRHIRPVINIDFPCTISELKQNELEGDILYQEIKLAVWD